MTIHLPNDLESSIRAEVASGHFASVDDAMAEAARLLLRQRHEAQTRAARPLTEDEFQQQLLRSGLIASLPMPSDPADRPHFEPVTLEGEPLSDMIVRERR